MLKVFASVKVDDEELEQHGQAGYVVEHDSDADPVKVRMDEGGEVFEFPAANLVVL
jgi:hypothetical protein